MDQKRRRLSAGELAAAKLPPGWKVGDDKIEQWFEFGSFEEAMAFVNRAAELARELDHHPDIDVRYRRVRLELTTHSAGGVTPMDLEFASAISE